MCKKFLRLLIMSMFIAFCVPIIACAAPEFAGDDIEKKEKSFLEYFEIDDEAISHILETEKQVDDEILDTVDEEDKEDINTFTNLTLNKGFREIEKSSDEEAITYNYIHVAPTFSDTKDILGEGEEDTVVSILVYQVTDAKRLIPTFITERQEIGPSKLFNESIELNSIGGNIIILAVKKDGIPEYKVYYINRKEEDTKKLLENIEVGFDVEDNQDEDKSFDDFLKEYTDDNKTETDIYEIRK